MPAVTEFGAFGPELLGPLVSGIETLTEGEIITFAEYAKVVLPLDGFVFWFRSGQFQAQGSLHYAVNRRQNEDETLSVSRVIFTAEHDVVKLSRIAPGTIAVGTYKNMRFSFAQHGPRFQQANLWHYAGDALYAALSTQLIDDPTQLNTGVPIVNNSLPAWLQLQGYNPVFVNPSNPSIMLYPSFAVPDNLPPPYGVVHVEPEATYSLQSAPTHDRLTSTAHQLTADRVRVTLYGCNNNVASDFRDLVNQYSYYTNNFGIMNMPVVRDAKRTQPEMVILAQKKVLDYEVSYIQSRINNIARALIEDVITSYFPPTSPSGFVGLSTKQFPGYNEPLLAS